MRLVADIFKQVRDSDFERELHERIELTEKERHSAIAQATTKVATELQYTATEKDTEIRALKTKLEAEEVTLQLAVTQAQSAAK